MLLFARWTGEQVWSSEDRGCTAGRRDGVIVRCVEVPLDATPSLAAELPGWFDLDFLRGGVTVGLIVVVLGIVLVLSVIRNLRQKLIIVAVLVAVAGGLWIYRVQLDECEKTCTCRFVFDDVDTNPPCIPE